ncbi:MAG: glutamate racemase [Deltaproteobacteria bacterium]|jgi:glutamate racemase|nr:glutamate racemase [Deltaproteobacteria bacterium]MCL5880914.1 glutamate racemase [Deltaproteobacteria bacterium]MDA8303704.1 glutamate racemase [Deltaproteobacteria bacterium]
MKYNNSPIGIFDSGLGGLTVFKEVRKILPYEDLIYFGDTARVPYGNKSKETILRYSMEISKFLISKGVKIVVAACNTSSSLALDGLRKEESVPIFGVIEPGAKKAVEVSSGGNIAVIGTSATIKSRAYSRVIYEEINVLKGNGGYKFKNDFKVIEKACPLLVPFVEEGFLNEEITKKIINYYLNPVICEKPSCLVLGCTHYPILKDLILEEVGQDMQIIDSGIETAKAVKCFLEKNGMLKDGATKGSELFFVSDDLEKFKELGERFLGRKIENVSIVNQFL